MGASAAENVRCFSPDADTLALSGELTFATAAQALREGAHALAAGAPSRLDLKGVTRVDGAGLACILALVAEASRNGRRLHVLNLPDGLRALARVSDTEMLLSAA